MIEAIEIAHFRCLKRVSLKDLRRVNLVVGNNASGKTTLLEAMFMAGSSSPDVLIKLNVWRTGQSQLTGSLANLNREIGDNLFHNFDQSHPVTIALNASKGASRTLVLSRDSSDSLIVPVTSDTGASGGGSASDVLPNFEWITPSGRHPFKPRFSPDGLDLGGKIVPSAQEVFFFAAQHPIGAAETGARFFDLSRKGNEKRVVATIRKEFPFITDLTLGVSLGKNAVFASVKSLPEKIPVSSISSGLNKLIALLCSVPTKPGSVALIDEVENGFHYTRLPSVWAALLDLCDHYDGQIFASTHSAECLQAAAQLAEKRPEAFSVIHIGPNGFTQFGGEKFVDAMKFNLEIR